MIFETIIPLHIELEILIIQRMNASLGVKKYSLVFKLFYYELSAPKQVI